MTYPRWYPTLVTLENGDVVALSGSQIAPPGPYLLFILNQQGVPSVAKTVLLSQ